MLTGDNTGGSKHYDSQGAVYLFTISGSGSTWGSGVSQKFKIVGDGVSLKNGDRFGLFCIPKCGWGKISGGCYW